MSTDFQDECWAYIFIFVGLMGRLKHSIKMLFVGLVILAWADACQRVGYLTLSVLLLFTLISHVIDNATIVLEAKKVVASQYAVWGVIIGFVGGISMGSLVSFWVIFMPFLGAMIGEMFVRWDVEHATRVGLGIWLGAVSKIAIAVTMVAIFCISADWPDDTGGLVSDGHLHS